MSDLCSPLVDSVQFQISCVNTNGGADSQCELKLFPSLCEDADELKKPPFPEWSSKNFDKELLPNTMGSGCEGLKAGVHSLEIRITSIRALLDVCCDSFAELLQPSLDRLTVRRDLFGIRHIFQSKVGLSERRTVR